ncbi:TIKI2 Metalloprotease, partial [Atractosteus spatula]|nr:TIKI2 Metalloprotease [Atractosteus spatula]
MAHIPLPPGTPAASGPPKSPVPSSSDTRLVSVRSQCWPWSGCPAPATCLPTSITLALATAAERGKELPPAAPPGHMLQGLGQGDLQGRLPLAGPLAARHRWGSNELEWSSSPACASASFANLKHMGVAMELHLAPLSRCLSPRALLRAREGGSRLPRRCPRTRRDPHRSCSSGPENLHLHPAAIPAGWPSGVLFALNQTLLQHESVRAGSLQGSYTTEDLIKHYNCGDLGTVIFNHDTSQLPHFVNSTLPDHERITAQQIDSYFRQELIYKRNERMGRRVTELMESSPGQTFFFAFGAGHFLGNNSVLDILRQEGYEVEHVSPGQSITERPEQPNVGPEGTEITEVTPTWDTGTSDQGATEDDPLTPHLLLPDSLSQLEEFGRQKKRPKKSHRHHSRQRHFSDLWVRMGASTTHLPNVRITNGYITVEPPLTSEEQHRRAKAHSQQPLPGPRSSAAPTGSTVALLLFALLTQLLCTS